jgi:hypothetical protein
MAKRGEGWHRRHALGLVGQLPDDVEDAGIVLAYMRDLVDNFLALDRDPSGLGARPGFSGLRLVESSVQLNAQAPPLAIIEPVECQSGNDSD